MKIINNINLLNSPIQLKSNNIYKNKSASDNKPINNKELLTVPYNINYATFTFKMNQRANILLKNSDKLNCAYSGKKLISPYISGEIFKILDKKTSAKSAVDFLNKYAQNGYLHSLESEIFNIFKSQCEENNDFKTILQKMYPSAKSNLSKKYLSEYKRILKRIKCFSENLKSAAMPITQQSLKEIKNGNFDKYSLLKNLDELAVDNSEQKLINEIGEIIFNLPDENNNLDAFIVKNAKLSHRKIAQKLLQPAIADIDNITIQENENKERLSNYLLVSKKSLKQKHNLSLSQYLKFGNGYRTKYSIQDYLYNLRDLTKNKKSNLYKKTNYIKLLAENLCEEAPELTNFIEKFAARKELTKINHINKVNQSANPKHINSEMTHGMGFMFGFADDMCCAFTRKPLISPQKAEKIYKQLAQKTNSESAIKFLTQFQNKNYLHEIENQVFEILKENANKSNDFHIILQNLKHESSKKLIPIQKKVLFNAKKFIPNLPENLKTQVNNLFDNTLYILNNGNFHKERFITNLKRINLKENNQNLEKIIEICSELPSTQNNVDAFITDNAWRSHYEIAKNLLNSSVAKVKFIIPPKKGGNDKLGNYILISSKCNNELGTNSLTNYIKQNDSATVKQNLQKYINDLITQVNDKSSVLHNKKWYPIAVLNALKEESSELKSISVNVTRLNHKAKAPCQNNIRQVNRKHCNNHF